LNPHNPVIRLCIEVTQAEFSGEPDRARALSGQAWDLASDHTEACIAAHYVARFQESLAARLHWNQVALDHASVAEDESVKSFFPSLYLNLGQSYALLGDQEQAQRYYDLAASLGLEHSM
jgi:hypothetical protein